MSPHHYFVIFLFAVNAAVSTVASIRNQQVPPLVSNPVDPFDLKVDVETLTEKSYKDFITKLRTKLGGGAEKSGNVPILPNYGTKPIRLFDVMLTTSAHTVTVRCRRDNLYVRGYLMETNGWMEFTEADGQHMVDPKSEFLKFGSSYAALEKEAKVSVTNIIYAQFELKKSVAALALPVATPAEKEKRGKSLIVMAQMIAEAARFVQISDHFASKIATDGVKLHDWMFTQLEQKWSQLSRPAQCKDKYNEKYTYTQVTINNAVYDTAYKLRDGIFGVMLKESKISDPKTCGIKKLADEVEGEAAVVLLSADM